VTEEPEEKKKRKRETDGSNHEEKNSQTPVPFDITCSDSISGSSTTIVAGFSGPLPPSDQFRRYEEVCPGAADRILKLTEKEAEHRHAKEMKELEGVFDAEKRGSRYAFWIIMVIASLGFSAIVLGNPWPGAAMTILPVITGHFIKGRGGKRENNPDAN